jgi:hypothetical protein
MTRSCVSALVVSLALAASGCCRWKHCPVCPGSPRLPTSKVTAEPNRPVVWRVLRGDRIVALAYQPLQDDVPWTLVYGDGVLPFRANDVLAEAPDISSGVEFTHAQLCMFLRERIALSHAEVNTIPYFNLNALQGPVPCE